MRRILLFIVTLFIVTLSANAQHLKFLGIPMNTNITNFSAKLKSKGYTDLSYDLNELYSTFKDELNHASYIKDKVFSGTIIEMFI